MAHLSLTIDMRGRPVEVALARISLATSPSGIALFMTNRARPFLRRRAMERFATEGDDASGKWKPLRPSTIIDRQMKGYGGAHPINVRTGLMKRTILDARGQVAMDPVGTTLLWPGVKPSGQQHFRFWQAQHGNERTGAPARPVVAANLTDMAGLLTLLGNFIAGPEIRSAARS